MLATVAGGPALLILIRLLALIIDDDENAKVNKKVTLYRHGTTLTDSASVTATEPWITM